MLGQCYYGASNMSSARSGRRAIIQQSAPLVMYGHCASHRLNLTIVGACKVQAFKNAEYYVGDIVRLFDFSPKRQRLLDRCIEKPEHTHAKKVKDACRTHLVELIESYSPFLQLLPAVKRALKLWSTQHYILIWVQTGGGMLKLILRPMDFSISCSLLFFYLPFTFFFKYFKPSKK